MRRLVRPVGRLAVQLAFSLSLLAALPCYAQAKPSGTVLTIAWAELDASDLGDEYRNVAVLVPRQLMSALAFVHERHPEAEESIRTASMTAAASLESARKAVADARAKRDLLALSVRDQAKRDADLEAAGLSVLAAEAALAEAVAAVADVAAEASTAYPAQAGSGGARTGLQSGLQPTEEGAAIAVPLSPWPGHAGGALLPAVSDPAVVCAEKKIDLLVYGTARLSGAFIAIDLALYVAALGRDAWGGTDYAPPDWVDGVVAAFVRPVAEAALGRSYSLVTYRVSPPDADLVVDGAPFSGSRSIFVEAGIHEAGASATGHVSAASTFATEPGSDIVVDLALEADAGVAFSVSTDPPGAAVYVDGRRTGFATAQVEGAAYPRVLRLSMPGFEDAQLIVRPEALVEDLSVSLEPSDGLTFDDRFGAGKDSFYRSLGWFVVSLPLTALSGGLFQTYFQTAEAYSAGGGTDEDEIARLQSGYSTSQAVFWVSAAASASLAINAAIRLAQYVGSAR